MSVPCRYIPVPKPEPHLAAEYFARLRANAAAATRAGYVGQPVSADPHS